MEKEEVLENLARPDYGFDLDEDLWSEVLPNLWQGGTDDFDTVNDARAHNEGAFITKSDFDTVITAYAWAQPADWLVKEFRYSFYDGDMKDIDFKQIYQAVRIAHEDWKAGKKVLIRCQAGWNRSGLIMALVLIKEGYSAQEAIDLIRKQRSPHALCNARFVAWLLSLPKAE